MVENQQKNKTKKNIFVSKMTNTFGFLSQKSQEKSVGFFSDFSHGITHMRLLKSAQKYKIVFSATWVSLEM